MERETGNISDDFSFKYALTDLYTIGTIFEKRSTMHLRLLTQTEYPKLPVCELKPGTPMGELMKQRWPSPDGTLELLAEYAGEIRFGPTCCRVQVRRTVDHTICWGGKDRYFDLHCEGCWSLDSRHLALSQWNDRNQLFDHTFNVSFDHNPFFVTRSIIDRVVFNTEKQRNTKRVIFPYWTSLSRFHYPPTHLVTKCCNFVSPWVYLR